MRTIEELLGEVPALQALAPEHRDTVAGCARNQVFEPGERIMREGDPADAFYVIREGQVAPETVVPGRGAVILQTLHDGELLGWSWLVPPYRTAFDARSIATTHMIAFDAACGASAKPTPRSATTCSSCCRACSSNASRTPACGCSTSTPSQAMSELPIAFRVADKRRETGDTWTLWLEPRTATVPDRFAPGQFAMLYAFGAGEAPISLLEHRR